MHRIVTLCLLTGIIACKSRVANDPKLISGIAIGAVSASGYAVRPNDPFPAVVFLQGATKAGTGVYITPSVILTAAHVADQYRSTNDFYGATQSYDNAAHVFRYYRHEQYVKDKTGSSRYDLGLLETKKRMPHIMNLSLSEGFVGQAVNLVGFGVTARDQKNADQTTLKRRGTNTIGSNTGGWLTLERQKNDRDATVGKNSIAASGDSGGPLVSKLNQILAIASGIGDDDTEFFNFYTNIHSPESRAFLMRAVFLHHFPLPATCCSCNLSFYKEFSMLWPDEHYSDLKNQLMPWIGRKNMPNRCIELNGLKHPILEGMPNYQNDETIYFKTTKCVAFQKNKCVKEFGIPF